MGLKRDWGKKTSKNEGKALRVKGGEGGEGI